MRDKAQTEVLYNAECPVCSFEINHYAKHAKDKDLAISFDDLTRDEAHQKWGLSKDQAAKRLHVRKNGQVYDGIPAFVVLWQDMPKYRWLAKLISTPGVYRLAVWSYDFVLAPALFRWHKLREKGSRA